MNIYKYLFFIERNFHGLMILIFMFSVSFLTFTHSPNLYPYLLFSFALFIAIIAIAFVKKKFKKRGEVNG